MRHLSVDLETFSPVDIKKSGLYKYVQSPDFQILLLAYSWDGGEVGIIDFTRPDSQTDPGWLALKVALQDPNVIKHAYNAAFEWYCLNRIAQTPLEQWRCTQLHGLYCGYPMGLAAISSVLGLPEDKRKSSVGAALIRTFCSPVKPTKSNGGRTRTLPHHEPERWELFKEYCQQDVVAEMAVLEKLKAWPVPEKEEMLYRLDQNINTAGVAVDMELVDSAIHCDDVVNGQLMAEAQQLSGLDNPNSAVQLSGWLSGHGVDAPNMQKATVKELAENTKDLIVKRILEIRQELAKTSVKKYYAMREAVCADGRMRGLLQFYGANRTGRWAGRIVQVQNLPRNYLETLEHARECVKGKKLDALKVVYGNIPDTLSQLIRTAFVPPPGKVFAVADFSAIEARVIAWLAGEQWRQDVFATHGKIYEASASAMFGVPLELIKKGNPEYELRQKGKVAELALGYQGSKGALINMGALTMGLMEDELPEIVRRWRNANKRIVDLWYKVERAAIEVMQTGRPVNVRGVWFARACDLGSGMVRRPNAAGATDGAEAAMDFFTITLPSGRKLFYAKPFLAPNQFGSDSLHYYGMDQETKKWGVQETYGGKLVENIVQAIARDCLAEALLATAPYYQIVMHVHDEAVFEVDKPEAVGFICEVMGRPIAWAPGLLLKAEGFICEFYKKE